MMSGWEWMVQDGLGSVRGVVDNSVGVLESRNYDPYGELFGATGSNQTSYGFTGEQTDGTGLVYLRARYYDPAAGVFTALDPFEGMWDEPMSINGYSYVHGNPVNLTDPNGENPLAFLIPIVVPVVGIILAYEVLQRAIRGAACLIEPHGAACKTKTLLENAACGLEELLKPRFPNVPVRNPVGSPVEQYPISTPEPGYYPFPVSTPEPGILPYPISTPEPGYIPFPNQSPIDDSPIFTYTAGRFSSNDPYVAELANDIEIAHGNIVITLNRKVYRPDNTLLTDIDIETITALIEVKSGSMAGIEGQVDVLVNSPIANSAGKQVLVYRGDGETNKQLRRVIESYGALVFGREDRQTLIDLLKP